MFYGMIETSLLEKTDFKLEYIRRRHLLHHIEARHIGGDRPRTVAKWTEDNGWVLDDKLWTDRMLTVSLKDARAELVGS